MRYLRQIDSTRFDVPTILPWAKELAVQGNFRDCDSKGNLIKPGPQPWVDQWNNVHAPEESTTGHAINQGGDRLGAVIKFQNSGGLITRGGIPCNHWIPNYILDEVKTQANVLDVMAAELEHQKIKTPPAFKGQFEDYLALYKDVRKNAYGLTGKQDPDITEERMIARFYELHPNLMKQAPKPAEAEISVVSTPVVAQQEPEYAPDIEIKPMYSKAENKIRKGYAKKKQKRKKFNKALSHSPIVFGKQGVLTLDNAIAPAIATEQRIPAIAHLLDPQLPFESEVKSNGLG